MNNSCQSNQPLTMGSWDPYPELKNNCYGILNNGNVTIEKYEEFGACKGCSKYSSNQRAYANFIQPVSKAPTFYNSYIYGGIQRNNSRALLFMK